MASVRRGTSELWHGGDICNTQELAEGRSAFGMASAPSRLVMCQNETPLPLASRDVVYRSLADGAVLFSIHDEVYYGLNSVGACLWEALPPVTFTVEAMCAHLRARYVD